MVVLFIEMRTGAGDGTQSSSVAMVSLRRPLDIQAEMSIWRLELLERDQGESYAWVGRWYLKPWILVVPLVGRN